MGGGGSHGRIWLQILADVLGRTVTAIGTRDASARGAAMLAIAAASGRDPRALAADWAVPGVAIEPDPTTVPRYEAQYAIFEELYPATLHLMHRLGELDRVGEVRPAR